jgi:hypothetical protein
MVTSSSILHKSSFEVVLAGPMGFIAPSSLESQQGVLMKDSRDWHLQWGHELVGFDGEE